MKSHASRKTHKRGFTLIELLVVIAIIAILAAILFPVFARARENARRASCQSNEKQIGLGIMQYTQDYDEKYPYQLFRTKGVFAADNQPNWIVSVQPYLKSYQLLACPSSTQQTGGAAITGSSYFYNAVFAGRSLSAFQKTAETIQFKEWPNNGTFAAMIPHFTAEPASGATFTPDNNFSEWGGFATNHFDGGNYLFGDGHVKWRKLTTVKAGDYGLTPNDAKDVGGVYTLDTTQVSG